MKTVIVMIYFSKSPRYAMELKKELGVARIVLSHSYAHAPAAMDIPATSTAYEENLLAPEIVERDVRLIYSKILKNKQSCQK